MLVHSFLCVFVCALVSSASRTSQQSTWRSTKPVWNRRRTTSSLNQLQLPSTSLLLSSSKAPSFLPLINKAAHSATRSTAHTAKPTFYLCYSKEKEKGGAQEIQTISFKTRLSFSKPLGAETFPTFRSGKMERARRAPPMLTGTNPGGECTK